MACADEFFFWGRYRSVWATSPTTIFLRRGTSSVSSWRRARRGIRWCRLVGRSFGIRSRGRGRVGRLRNRFEGAGGSRWRGGLGRD